MIWTSNLGGALTAVETGVHLLDQIAQFLVRLAIPACFKVVNMTLWVNDEDLVKRDSNITVAHGICVSITEARVKRVCVRRKQFANSLQTCDLKNLRLLLNDFAVERS
jgi:hypothetical protein